ncbi:MAG: DUF885 domain-containing protein [Gemmatimonadota bacterium]
MTPRRVVLAMVSLAAAVAPVLAQTRPARPNAATAAFHALLDEDWQFRLREFPESATLLGDDRYNDRLTDLSPEAIERRKAWARTALARVRRIDRNALEGQDRISWDLFVFEKELEVDGQRYPSELMPLDQINGPQLTFPALIAQMPYATLRDYGNYLERLRAWPRYLEQVQALMEQGIATGWVLPAVPLRTVPAQLVALIVDDASRSPLYQPVTRFPAGIAPAARERIAREAGAIIVGQIAPAVARLKAFIETRYLPAGAGQTGASTLPDGAGWYAYSIRNYTTTSLGAKEIHELGLAEVARIRAAMDSVIRASGFIGSFKEFLQFLRTDPRFYYRTADELVTGYRDVAKRADAALPALFATLPRLTYGVQPFPDFEAPAQTTARYFPGAADGTRPGYFMVNTYKLESRPRYEMEALTLHEAVPGHHLQIARAQELGELPEFRRNGGYNAFVEGWALYAESLGPAMGMYQDPYSKFGQLTYEMWRACRLVVDTGIHAFGWSRERAIQYMLDNTAKSEQDVTVEVDRYIVWPGQALGYKLGELRIKALRARAEQALGDRFDLRRFHNAVLDNGPLPLDVLDRQMEDWIRSVRAAR